MEPIAHIRTNFPTKFGLPRQSGISEEIKGVIVFEPEYRVKEAFRGLEDFSHIWVLWQFSEAIRESWKPTVRPPLLGGNKRIGVFATRSPFRPNNIGLSCVKIEKIDFESPDGPLLYVSGCDMMDKTPVYDIKPYLPYTDSRNDATGGFTNTLKERKLTVECDEEQIKVIPQEKRAELLSALSADPRPSYQSDGKEYGLKFSDFDVGFCVKDGILTITRIIRE